MKNEWEKRKLLSTGITHPTDANISEYPNLSRVFLSQKPSNKELDAA